MIQFVPPWEGVSPSGSCLRRRIKGRRDAAVYRRRPVTRATQVISRLEAVAPKVCRLLEEAEEDPIAFYLFRREHWTEIRSTNPLERVNKEIGRRSDVVGIVPNDPAVIRLCGALLLEQNDEWLVRRRYLSIESMTLALPATEDASAGMPLRPRRRSQRSPRPEPPTTPSTS